MLPYKEPWVGTQGTEFEVSSTTCELCAPGKSLHLTGWFESPTYKIKGLSHRISKALSSAICPGF